MTDIKLQRRIIYKQYISNARMSPTMAVWGAAATVNANESNLTLLVALRSNFTHTDSVRLLPTFAGEDGGRQTSASMWN